MKAPLATFHEVEPARQLQTRLAGAGIPSIIHDESKLQRFWFMSEPLAAIHIQVNQSDYLRARDLIEQWHEAEGVLRDAVCCPECGSSRTEYPQLTRKFVTPTLGAILLALKVLPRSFYCYDCHYIWPVAQRVDPPRDALGWPMRSRLFHPEQNKHIEPAVKK